MFDEQRSRVDELIFGPTRTEARAYEEGEFFKVWRYKGLREVKEKCPDREARNMMRRWYNQRYEHLWVELGYDPVPDDWSYHTASDA